MSYSQWKHTEKYCGFINPSSWVLWFCGQKPEGDKNTKKQMSKNCWNWKRNWKCPFWDLSVSPFHFPLASPYLWLWALSMPGLSYCLCLVWDQIRLCCQLAQPVLCWKSCLQPFSRVHMSIPIAHDNRDSAGLQQPLCWYQESCRRQVTAKAEASCLSDTGGKRGSVYFSLLLCYWKISPTSSAYLCTGDGLTMENR